MRDSLYDFARLFLEAFVTFLGIVALAAIYGFVIWEWVRALAGGWKP